LEIFSDGLYKKATAILPSGFFLCRACMHWIIINNWLLAVLDCRQFSDWLRLYSLSLQSLVTD
jgi:hypothetical protein